ncbi:MAG: hypothetical protein KDC87_01495, partial [Planctomycetes bacterium]|nr:hypothetical protein [Planctomycetota bacterium]
HTRIHERGRVALLGASAVAIPADFSTTPVLSAAAARAIAETHLLAAAQPPRGQATRLLIWARPYAQRPTHPVLAYEVAIDARPARLVVGRVYVDARNGTVLEHRDDVYSCRECGTVHVRGATRHQRRMLRALAAVRSAEPTATLPMALTGKVLGWTNVGENPTDPLQNIPLANLKVTSSAGTAFTDETGSFSIPYTGTTAVTVNAVLEGTHCATVQAGLGTALTASASITPGVPGTLQFGTQTMGEQGHAQTSAYYFVDRANLWLRGHLPTKTTEMNRLDTLRPTVNSSGACNGFYTGLAITLLSSSTTCNHAAYSTFLLHEWGHGLDDVFGGINTTDGLSEGWADVIATYYMKSPLVFANFWKRPPPNYGRTALNTRTYPTSGGTHDQGEVWMGWTWDVRTNLIATLGSSAGSDRAEKIVIPSIVA